MDAFYVSVELLNKPELIEMPVAVGGNSDRRGVISTCNYIARQYGVRSAMATQIALSKCPSLVVLPGNMALYKQYSQLIREVFQRYTLQIEPLSLDEAYLDVSEVTLFEGSATRIAAAIREDIFNGTGLTASAGIAPLKYLAKVASDVNKPNGQCVIPPSQVQSFIDLMPLERIPGVGKVTLAKLHQENLHVGLDVRQRGAEQMSQRFGQLGDMLWRRCNGIDEREVVTSRVRKSIGVERTFPKDLRDTEQLNQLLLTKLLPELQHRIDAAGATNKISKVSVKIKFADFHQITRETGCNELDTRCLLALLLTALSHRANTPVRLMGLSVGLAEQQNPQLTLTL